MNWREKLYVTIEKDDGSSHSSAFYDLFMVVIIIASFIPILTRETTPLLHIVEWISLVVFIVDYLMRWMTADYKLQGMGSKAFALYPFTPFAIIDLLSIFPGFGILNPSFKMLRFFRLLRLLRILKLVRYSENLVILIQVLNKQKRMLLSVFAIAAFYIFFTAAIMFNLDSPEVFPSFFDALYWATTALTTVGYGDIYPVSDIGRIISMISSVFGVAIIALPSGIITGGFLKVIEESHEQK